MAAGLQGLWSGVSRVWGFGVVELSVPGFNFGGVGRRVGGVGLKFVILWGLQDCTGVFC